MFGGIKKKNCTKCKRDITVNNFERHYESCKGVKKKKVRGIDFDPNIGYTLGTRSAWNKGKRSKPDNRNPEYIGKIGGYRANAGKSKKFKVKDSFGNLVTLQSSYELQCSEILNELGIQWIRPKHLKYDNGRKYFPDFYLIEHDIFLDPKNDYLAKMDYEKIEKVKCENKVRVFILTKDKLNSNYIKTLVGPDGEGIG